eukprot:tig00020960_g16560.t1
MPIFLDLVGTLSALFAEFDRAARARGLEPLKTLGDAVLAGAFPRRPRPAAGAARRDASNPVSPSGGARAGYGPPRRRRSSTASLEALGLAAGAEEEDAYGSEEGAESSGESDAGGGEWGGEGEVERALQYALDCRDILASFVGPAGHRLQMRFGVAVGPAVGAILGRQRWSYEVWGPAVSEAQEREAAGRPQEILVSREVYEAARGAFEFELRDGLPFLLRRLP